MKTHSRCCGTTRLSRPSIIIQAFGDVFGKHVMLGMDEPEHGRHRALVSKAFSQKALARWEDELVGKVGNALIDRFVDRGSADLVKEFNFPYPTLIIAGLLGLPQEDFPQFQRWSISLLSFTVNPERGREASQALAEYFAPILAARREEPRDDLISGLAAAEIDGEKLSDEEIFSFLRLLLPAGVETTYRVTRATCCSPCCLTQINWTPYGPTAPYCRRRSKRRCGGSLR